MPKVPKLNYPIIQPANKDKHIYFIKSKPRDLK